MSQRKAFFIDWLNLLEEGEGRVTFQRFSGEDELLDRLFLGRDEENEVICYRWPERQNLHRAFGGDWEIGVIGVSK